MCNIINIAIIIPINFYAPAGAFAFQKESERKERSLCLIKEKKV